MKRLWIVSEFFYPMVTTTGYYVTSIAEYLAVKGMDVNVICTNARYYDNEVYEYLPYEVYKGIKINRLSIKPIDKNSFIKRTYRMMYTSLVLSRSIISKVKRGDNLVIVTNPAFLLLFMPFLSFLKGFDYTTIVHDIFPENLVAIGKLRRNSLYNRFLTHQFNRAYAKSRICVSIGRDMSDVVARKVKGKCNIALIPNWADIFDVYPIKKENTDFYMKHGANGLTFQFAGNLGYAQGLDNLLEAIDLIDNYDIKFCFIGSGAKSKDIEEFAKKHNNVTYAGLIDRSKQNDFLNACDIGFVTLSDGMYGLGVPSKSYNILASGKPILFVGNENSEIALCIKEYEIGWIVEPNNPTLLCEMIKRIYSERENLEPMKIKARDVAEKIYAKDVILEKYYQLFTENEE
jgi:glycosyltransferase involved in cell wall biosynthesis